MHATHNEVDAYLERFRRHVPGVELTWIALGMETLLDLLGHPHLERLADDRYKYRGLEVMIMGARGVVGVGA